MGFFSVLVAGHLWLLPPAAPDHEDFWDQEVPDPETQLEPGQQVPCKSFTLCLFIIIAAILNLAFSKF